MSWEDRIEAVSNDLNAHTDIFRPIGFFGLAALLQVPFEDLRGENWYKWACYLYTKKRTLTEYCADGYSLSELIESARHRFAAERYMSLIKEAEAVDAEEEKNLDFLGEEETAFLTVLCNEIELNAEIHESVNFYTMENQSGKSLRFQIADNGYEWYNDGTPYDDRDGLFVDPESEEYVFEMLNNR
jgi:hypothetical protein